MRSWGYLAGLVCVAVALGACGPQESGQQSAPRSPAPAAPSEPASPESPAPESPSAAAEPSESASPSPRQSAPEPAPDLASAAIRLTEVARLDSPIAMAARPGTTQVWVAQRGGQVVTLGGGAPLLDLGSETTTDGERGLLGITFSPDGQRFYASYTDLNGHSRLHEWRMAGDRVDAASRRELLFVEQPYANHNGGNVAFGADGYLYYGLGDGGSGGDPLENAQDNTTLLGKMVRIDPLAERQPYGIPRDNPYAAGGPNRPEIWALGLRNPWRFSFDRQTGDLWISDAGQNSWEEIDFLAAGDGAGANFGWDQLEGSHTFEGEAPPGAVGPLFEYSHDSGCNVIGGYVYRGEAVAALRGAYLYSDLCGGDLWALVRDGDRAGEQRSLDVTVPDGAVVSFGEDGRGELYALSLAGGVYRVDPA